MFYNILSKNNSSKFVGVHFVQFRKLLVEGFISTFEGVTIKPRFVIHATLPSNTLQGSPIAALKLVSMPIELNFNFGNQTEAAVRRYFDNPDVIF